MESDEAEKLSNVLSSKCIDAGVKFGLFGLQHEAKEKIREKAFENFVKVDIEYGKYGRILPEINEGAKDTLFWEFGKNVASIAGIEKVLACNSACLKLITHALQNMNPKQFVENLQKKQENSYYQ